MINNISIKKLLLMLNLACLLSAATTDTITHYGITWKFASPVEYGQFVTGDYYVVGNCTIISITPIPGGGRNGSELNPPMDPAKSGFDSRITWEYIPSYLSSVPISMKPGDTLISTISLPSLTNVGFLRQGQETWPSPIKSASVLTCLSAAVPADAFRPSYADRSQKIYRANDLKRNLLPSLPYGKKTFNVDIGSGKVNLTVKEFADRYKRPWLDSLFYSFDAPTDYMPQYGHELARAAGISTLILMTDLPLAEKEDLLIGVVQRGIDLWGICKSGHRGWIAAGGHGSGRKLPIVFAGIMLGDTEMASPDKTYPNVSFGEDRQTMYDNCWTGAKTVYTGHMGVDKNGNNLSSAPGRGKYEHLQPKDWPKDPSYSGSGGYIGEAYRRPSTSDGWIGEALAARIMHAEKKWDHDAFFDYCDRWMTEDDTEHLKIIKQQTGVDFSADFCRQRKTWDPFVDEMWAAYRNNLPPEGPGGGLNLPANEKKRVTVYPNPVRLSGAYGNTVKLTNFIDNSRITIYNSMGEAIATLFPGISRGKTRYVLGSIAEWDGTNENNERVPAGIYYCIALDAIGNKAAGKIAILK